MKCARVMLVYPSLPPVRDGGADYVDQLARALVARGIHVVVTADQRDAEPQAERPYHVRLLSDLCAPWTKDRIARERRELKAMEIDVVHVIYPTPRYPDTYAYPAVAAQLSSPVVATVWGLNLGARGLSWATKIGALRFFANADVVTTHDPEYLAFLRTMRFFRRPTRLIPVGYNLAVAGGADAVSPAYCSSPERQTIVYFGGLDASRGFEDLLAAMRELRRTLRLRLKVIGGAQRKSPFYERMHRLAVQLGVDDTIEWTEFLPAADVETALRGAGAVVLPFRRNSLGRSSVAAAMTVGAPLVIAAGRWTRGFLADEENCLVVPRHAPHAIARAVRRLQQDEGLAKRISSGAVRTAREFSWDEIGRVTARAYEEAVAGRRR